MTRGADGPELQDSEDAVEKEKMSTTEESKEKGEEIRPSPDRLRSQGGDCQGDVSEERSQQLREDRMREA